MTTALDIMLWATVCACWISPKGLGRWLAKVTTSYHSALKESRHDD